MKYIHLFIKLLLPENDANMEAALTFILSNDQQG